MGLLDKEEILKGNKLMAEYINLPLVHKVYTNALNSYGGKYHESMDWLLPVINKISKSEQFTMISANDDDWEITIETTGYHYATQAYQTNKPLIEGCWLACIEYIEKFNTGTLVVAKK